MSGDLSNLAYYRARETHAAVADLEGSLLSALEDLRSAVDSQAKEIRALSEKLDEMGREQSE